MIPIYYQSSEGVIVNLIAEPYMMMTDTELLNYEWQWETVGTNFPKISTLKKSLISPPFSIRISGTSKSDMMNNLEYLTSIFDRDCFINKMGRIYIGNFYRECFITKSTKGKVFEKTHTTVQYAATSDDVNWKYDKVINVSGIGAITGELASTSIITANKASADIEITENTDKTIGLKWGPATYGNIWLKFDLGTLRSIESFSGLHLTRASGGTPISCDVQIWDDTYNDITASVYSPTMQESEQTNVKDFSTIIINSFGQSGWENVSLIFYGYYNREVLASFSVEVGEEVDVYDYDSFSFKVIYETSGMSTSVDFTKKVENWTTLESISVFSGSQEVIVENEEFRALRLNGSFLGSIDDDAISIYSDDVAPDRDLTDLGCSIENGTLRYTFQDDEILYHRCTPTDLTKPMYLIFDDTPLVLKRVYCQFVRSGNAKVQGLLNDEWVDIIQLEDGTNQTYNTNYEKIRLRIRGETILQHLSIYVQTDAKITNESYAPSDAVIQMRGTLNNPTIMIGENEYGANIELTEGNTLEIDTKNKTVRLYDSDGGYTNKFSTRLPDTFEKIDSGENSMIWSGAMSITVILEQARSEPKWN